MKMGQYPALGIKPTHVFLTSKFIKKSETSILIKQLIKTSKYGNFHKSSKKHILERDTRRSFLITLGLEILELIPLWKTIFDISMRNLFAFPHISIFLRENLLHVATLTTPITTIPTS